MLLSALAGLALGLSLIIAIGAQNAFVLRQGLRREHIVPVIVVCALSDAILIGLGVGGAGLVLERLPWLIEIIRWGGFAFLVGYGVLAARRALRPRALAPTDAIAPKARAGVIGTTLALTWLNPHVYLDTVVLLGSISSTYGDGRWAFGAGAALGSILWFTTLGLGARLLTPLFARPAAWRVLDGVIAMVMIALAISLVLPR